MEKNSQVKLKKFQEDINYQFKDINLLKQALTTPKLGKETNSEHYEILETIGDAVIKLIFSLKIYNQGINDPDTLTRNKLCLENNQNLAKVALNMGLEEYVFKAENQEVIGTKIMADIFESICGAIYLDSNTNLDIVDEKIIDRFMKNWDEPFDDSYQHAKNHFLEFLQQELRFTPILEFKFEESGEGSNLRWKVKGIKILDTKSKECFSIPKSITSFFHETKKEAEKDFCLKVLKLIQQQ